MNIKIQLLTIGLYLSLSIPLSQAASLYLLHDQACMDRMLYSHTTNGKMSDVVVYRLKASASEFVYLEISPDQPRSQEFLPAQVYSCGNSLYNEKFVEAINNGSDQVFLMIKGQNNQYNVYKIAKAAYFQQIGPAITYISERYNFNLNTNNALINIDISIIKTKGKEILFDGKFENDCSGAYLLKKTSQDADPRHTDFVLVPELGIREERYGVNASDAYNNVRRLEKINDYTPDEYLRLLCQEQPPANKEELTEKDIPKAFDQTPKTPSPKPAPAANPCGGAISGGGYHIVQKGETLYRISKSYGVTVAQIQAWNGLGSSTTIHVCDKLKVAEKATDTKPSDAIADSRPAVTMPAPYEDNTFVAKSVAAREKAWESTTGYYVAQSGETVASLAIKFGYTEARFRSINGFTEEETIKAGQLVKTTDCPLPAVSKTSTSSTTDRPRDYSYYGGVPTELTVKSPYKEGESFSVDLFKDQSITPQIYSSSDLGKDFRPRTVSGGTFQPESRTIPPAYDQTIPQGYESGSLIKRATHTVKEGENISQIARMYGMTEQRLRLLNNMSYSDTVIPNQKIFIN